jgi:hypothetical protein
MIVHYTLHCLVCGLSTLSYFLKRVPFRFEYSVIDKIQNTSTVALTRGDFFLPINLKFEKDDRYVDMHQCVADECYCISHSPFLCITVQFLQFKPTMHTTFLKSKYYNTPAPTCFRLHWPIIRDHTVVQNSCFKGAFMCTKSLLNFNP